MQKFDNGDKVFWNDPEGISSGEYVIVECLTDDGEDSVYLIANDFSEAEVLEYELDDI